MRSRRVHPPYQPAIEPTGPRLSGQCGVSPPGARCLVGRETIDQFADLEALAGFKSSEALHEQQPLNRFARWSSESFLKLYNKCGILHLSPSMRNTNGISRKTRGLGPKGRY